MPGSPGGEPRAWDEHDSINAFALPLSPFVSTYLREFGRSASSGEQHTEAPAQGHGQGRREKPKRSDSPVEARGASPHRSAGDRPDQFQLQSQEVNAIAKPVTPVKVGPAAVAPFRNDGERPFNEWPAARIAVDERHPRMQDSSANDGKTRRGASPSRSPRLVLPSIAGDAGSRRASKPKRAKGQSAAMTHTDSGRHSAPPGHNAPDMYVPPTAMGDSYLPIDLWNNVVARNVDCEPQPHFQHFNAMLRPFNRLKMRQYMNSTVRPLLGKVSNHSKDAVPRSIRRKPEYGAIFEEGREAASQAARPEAPPSRLEASLLKDALDKMTENIKNAKGEEPRHLAREAAVRGKIDQVSPNLEPELYVLDIILSELVKQENVSCRERGGVLETIRLRMLEAFSTASLGVARACSDMDHLAREAETIADEIAPLRQENESLAEKLEELESENSSLKQHIKELSDKKLNDKTSNFSGKAESADGDEESDRELNALRLVKEANDMRDMLQSKMSTLIALLQQKDASRDVMQLQIHELEERVRRDAASLEFLGQTVAQYKMRLAWVRVIAWARRAKKPTAEAETQDGEGLPDPFGGTSSIHRGPSTVRAASTAGGMGYDGLDQHPDVNKRVVTKETLKGQVIAYSAFWANVVQQAEKMDFSVHSHLQMSKKELLELIAKTYSEKILADDIDERSNLTRQTLPEFLYDYYLDLFGEPQLAEQALVIILANVRTYDSTSARTWMFARFLNVGGQPLPSEALSIYLASLVRIQNGQVPLLPNYDGLSVDAARALRVIEYVFMQVPYIVRAKVLQECEKLSTGLHIDLDSLLLCIVDQWKEESGRAEERLRALFVASDLDGDGNLDFSEFTSIINNLRGGKGHREMLRMYAEMTLNQQVDCNTFVRVCRKYRFFTFEVGPHVRKSDPAAKEVFDSLDEEWGKFDRTAMELLTIMAGTAAANRLEQLVVIFKKKLAERSDPEESWHLFRHVVEGVAAIVRNHPMEYPAFFAGMAVRAVK